MLKEIKGASFLTRFGIRGMVLYPFVLYASENPSEEIRRHEMVHVRQIRETGVLRFYLKYVFEYLSLRSRGHRHDAAYRGISFEIEAFELEKKIS